MAKQNSRILSFLLNAFVPGHIVRRVLTSLSFGVALVGYGHMIILSMIPGMHPTVSFPAIKFSLLALSVTYLVAVNIVSRDIFKRVLGSKPTNSESFAEQSERKVA